MTIIIRTLFDNRSTYLLHFDFRLNTSVARSEMADTICHKLFQRRFQLIINYIAFFRLCSQNKVVRYFYSLLGIIEKNIFILSRRVIKNSFSGFMSRMGGCVGAHSRNKMFPFDLSSFVYTNGIK